MQFSIRFLLTGLLISLFGIAVANVASVPQKTPTIVILGDSLSAAYNIPVDQSWPVLFHQKLQIHLPETQLINASISGETTSGGLQRLPELLQRYQPTHLIIELGGNDGLRGQSFKTAQRNLQQMIRMGLEQGAEILLIGVRLPPNLGPVYSRRFQDMYETLASDNDIRYLPRFLEGIAGSPEKLMQADGIHPTAKAQVRLADKVFSAFEIEGSGAKQAD